MGLGSYVTIINNAEGPFFCKVEKKNDDSLGSIVDAVVDNFKKTLVAAGVVLPVLVSSAQTATSPLTYTIFNIPDATTLKSAKTDNGPLQMISETAETGPSIPLAQSIANVLGEKGYDLIKVGEEKKYGKYALSSWKYATCKMITPHNGFASIQTVRMGPLVSGSTNKANRNHKIAYWFQKDGSISEKLSFTKDAKHRVLQEDDTKMYNITMA